MQIHDLKVGDKIGVFFYDDWRGRKATIETVTHISSTGTITVSSGTRYTYQGREVGALGDATYLCSVSQAEEIIARDGTKYQESPVVDELEIRENRLIKLSQLAADNAIRILHQYGYYKDKSGKLAEVESKIAAIVQEYLEEMEK